MLDTDKIIRATERMWTLSKRAWLSSTRDDHRDAMIDAFKALCTDCGKLATKFKPADWMRVQIAVTDLHSAAVADEEARAGTFTQIGSELRLSVALHGLATNLGFTLEPIDDAAQAEVEGHGMRSAAE